MFFLHIFILWLRIADKADRLL